MIVPGTNFQAELDRETGYRAVILIYMNLTTGPRRFAMWPHDVFFGGNTFFGLSPLESVDPTEQSSDTPLTEKYFRWFVQNDPDFLFDLQQNSRNRFMTERLVFLNAAGAVIDSESIVLTQRRMLPGAITLAPGGYWCDLATESRFFQNANRAPRTYSDADQKKIRNSTDDAFVDAGKTMDVSRPDWVQKSGLPG